jgi:acetolactate synthase-1/2/3 large subunit
VIDIPKDVQIASAAWHEGPPAAPQPLQSADRRAEPDEIARAVELIANAKRAGVLHRRRRDQFRPASLALLRELQALTGAPVTSTLMGLGAFPADMPDWLGMLGMHGTYEANMAMNQADLIVCIGARFDDRVTGRLDAFAPNSTKIHIDIDRSLDQQDRAGRSADHRRLRPRAGSS